MKEQLTVNQGKPEGVLEGGKMFHKTSFSEEFVWQV